MGCYSISDLQKTSAGQKMIKIIIEKQKASFFWGKKLNRKKSLVVIKTYYK
jgi:hypothetical protein